MRNDVFYHAQAAYRLGDCKRGRFIFVLADGTGIEREAQTIEAYLTRIAAEYADSLTNIFDTPVVRFVASGRYDVTARWEDGHITLQATSSGADYTWHGKMARNREVRVDDCKSFVDALRKASNRSRLVCKAIGADMMTYARLLELFAKRPEDSSWCEFSPSADVWPNAADTRSEDVEAATVEEDTRDVSEIITEANKKYLGGKGVLYRVPAYHDAIVYVTPSNRWVGYSVADGYEQWNHDPRAAAELPWDKTLQELEAAGLIVQCFEELDIPPYVTAYELEDYEQSQEVSRLTEEAGWEFDGGMIMRPVASDDTTETVVVEPVEVEHDDVVDVELAETSETIPVVEAEPRAVGSVPTLPAECEAVTQEIPEVPPHINEDARVLAVSEAVIPSGMRVGEMFPSVPYRAVRAFKRVVAHADGTVSKKKVAYAFRVGDVVQVLRRDRYVESGVDKAVEAEIAAYVAKLRQAA